MQNANPNRSHISSLPQSILRLMEPDGEHPAASDSPARTETPGLSEVDPRSLARSAYLERLEQDPQDSDAFHQLGILEFHSGNLQAAWDYVGTAIALEPGHARYYCSMGNVVRSMGDLEAATGCYLQAVQLDPQLAEAYCNLGCVQKQQGCNEQALYSCLKAIDLNPDFAVAHNNCGSVMRDLGRCPEAMVCFDKAIALEPTMALAHFNRALTLQALRQHEAALTSLDEAIRLQGDYLATRNHRGVSLQALRRFEEAYDSYQSALAVDPLYPEALVNLGNLLREWHRTDEALAVFEKVLAARPDYAVAYLNFGNVLMELHRYQDALDTYDRAIALDDEDRNARWNKALALLVLGHYPSGFELYEHRWQRKDFTAPKRNFPQPLWLGREEIAGKTILLHAEQGLGDTVQFCRFIPQVVALGARVIVEAPAALLPLLRQIDGVSKWVEKGKKLPRFDMHCPMMSLALAFGTTLGSIPSSAGYLKADTQRLSKWSQKLGNKRKPRVGLAWSGNPQHCNDAIRSIDLAEMMACLPQGYEYVSLQRDVRQADRQALQESRQIRHFGEELQDFADTAALCELMDLVISVDTSVAHLSGAMGRPTWVLVNHFPDWRWLLGREDSPWYDSVTVLRQPESWRWEPVLELLARALAQPSEPVDLAGAIAQHQAGEVEAAAESYTQALEANPANAEALHLLGVTEYQRGNHLAALDLIVKAISLLPNSAACYNNLGHVARGLRDYEAAAGCFYRAIALAPDYAEAYSNLACTQKDLGQLEAALLSCEKAIQLKPGYAGACLNRGSILKDMRRMQEALCSIEDAIKAKPDYAEAYVNRGNTLKEMMRIDEALASYDVALHLQPGWAETRWNQALTYLVAGDYRRGFPLYESRWQWKDFPSEKRNFPQPLWLGREEIAGKTILLHAEQGLGDTVQFCRFIPQVVALGARVIVEAPAALLPLLRQIDGVSKWVEKGKKLPRFDMHCPMMSLALAFGTTLGSIPSSAGYLKADTQRLSKWSQKLGNKRKPRVGLAWSGNPQHCNDAIRSIDLAEMMACLPQGYEYVSLQRDVRQADRQALQESRQIRHFGEELQDFADTAALCELMDLVISVDTSVAHLSGAMGRPTWVLVNHFPDWRWLLGREDSPWYDSVTVLRQPESWHWEPVLGNVRRHLTTGLASHNGLDHSNKFVEGGTVLGWRAANA